MSIRRELRAGHAVVAFALAMGCDSGTTYVPPVDSGTDSAVDSGAHDAAVDSGAHDAAVDSGGAKVTEVSCASVTPSQDIAWFFGVASPVNVTISAGQVVQWHVTDAMPHTVTSGTSPTPDGLFNTSITSAAPKCFRFDAVGSYPFYCTIHALTATPMFGTVTVQ